MKRLEGKVAIVTGSDRGIGKGIAMALAKEGCKVVVNSYKESEEGRTTVDEIKNSPNTDKSGFSSKFSEIIKKILDCCKEW